MKDDYQKIKEGEKVSCFYDNCEGYLKKSREDEKDLKVNRRNYLEYFLICRCSINCKHKWVVLKSSLASKVVHFKY